MHKDTLAHKTTTRHFRPTYDLLRIKENLQQGVDYHDLRTPLEKRKF